MGKIWQSILGGAAIVGGIGTALWFTVFNKKKTEFSSLDHCDVPSGWTDIRNASWSRAATVLKNAGLNPVNKLKTIEIQPGIKMNPKSKQWGRPMMINGQEFWYAGGVGGSKMSIVGTPAGRPYARSLPIMSHEAGEAILDMDKTWRSKSIDERNNFLWSLGL